MFISKTSRYALQAAAFLAERWEDGEAVQAWEIAEHTGVPRNYLSKVLHQLARSGVFSSERGPKGGFRLAGDPAGVSLSDILEPLEVSLPERHCLLGRKRCSDQRPCAAHESWKAISEDMERFLDETVLSDLVDTE